MCQFLSGWISLDGRTVYPGDLVHHENGARIHGIDESVACPWEWLPGEDRPSVVVSKGQQPRTLRLHGTPNC